VKGDINSITETWRADRIFSSTRNQPLRPCLLFAKLHYLQHQPHHLQRVEAPVTVNQCRTTVPCFHLNVNKFKESKLSRGVGREREGITRVSSNRVSAGVKQEI
jgi:hypothetical protein